MGIVRLNWPVISTVAAALYCVGMALAWSLSTQMPVDWAYELLVNNRFQLSYYESNPPLYSWIVHVVRMLMPPGPGIFLLINYCCLFASLTLVLAIASRILVSRVLIALAPWSLFLDFYFSRLNFGFEHTQLVILFYLLTVLLLMRIATAPRPLDFLLLGLAAGCGIIAKYDYCFGIAILLTAFCFRPRLRARIATPWFAVSGVIAASIVAPVIWSFYAEGWGLFGLFAKKTGIHGTVETGGLGETIAILFVYAGPSLALIGAVMRLGRADDRPNEADEKTLLFDFLRDVQWIGLAVIVIGVSLFGVRRIDNWYLHVFFVLLPLICLGVADRRPHIAQTVPLCAASIFAMVFLGTANRLLALTPLCMGECRDIVPYDRLAVELRRAGFRQGAVLSPDVRVSGNLKRYFPESAIGDLAGIAPDARVPGAPIGQCLVIWQDQQPADPPQTQSQPPNLPSATGKIRTVEIPFRFGTIDAPAGAFRRRSAVWRFLLDEHGSQKCG